MEWQPIETAPKDGTEIDIWGAVYADYDCAGRITDAKWDEREGAFTFWDDLENWGEGGNVVIAKPTHWMPLPPPPAGDE